MKEFFVGLLVLLVFVALSFIGLMLFPIIVVMGFFLKFVISMVLLIFAVWALGKASLMGIEWMKNKRYLEKKP